MIREILLIHTNNKNETELRTNKKLDDNGFTLIELLVVIVFISILASITVPSFISLIETAKKGVCENNCSQVQRMYEKYLILENTAHSEAVFAQFLMDYEEEICPDDGDIGYFDGEVQCSVHSSGVDSGDDDEGSVPFL